MVSNYEDILSGRLSSGDAANLVDDLERKLDDYDKAMVALNRRLEEYKAKASKEGDIVDKLTRALYHERTLRNMYNTATELEGEREIAALAAILNIMEAVK